MSKIEKIFNDAKRMGMDDKQAQAFTFIVCAEMAKEVGNAEASNHYEMRMAEIGVK